MNKEEYLVSINDVVYLASCMVHDDVPDERRVAEMDIKKLYNAAKRHQLTGIIGYALEAAGVRDEAFIRERGKAIRKTVLLDVERSAVFKKFDESGIWYMPLKGIVLKELYPRIGMRQMADNDILYDFTRSEDVRVIMESLGFETKSLVANDHDHDHYVKLPACSFEMHRALMPLKVGKKMFDYFRNVKDRLIKDDGNSCGYHFSDEDFYIYMIAHEYKHFANSGTGLRSVLDTYVYCTRMEGRLDWKYIERELKKLGLHDFEKSNRSLALHLFGGEQLTDEENEMYEYIAFSGTYGTQKNFVQNGIRRKGRAGFLFSRVFVSYPLMAAHYPILKKLPFLLPIFWIIRLVTVFSKKPKKVLYQFGTTFRKIEK